MQGCVQKKRNRWYIRYYIGKDANGKWKEKSEGSWATKREAEKVLRMRITEIEGSFERKVENSTLEVYLNHWFETYCKTQLAANTIRGYRVNIENHIVPRIGHVQLNRLKPNDIQTLYDDLLDSGLSGTSVRYVHNNLHKALNAAVKEQLILRNPADYVYPPKVSRFEGDTLTPEQSLTLLKACNGTEIYLPVFLAVSLGLRRGEALGLQWDDIDFVSGTVTIRHSANFTKDGITLSTTKTKNSRRTLQLPDALKRSLEYTLSTQEERKAQYGVGYNPYNLVCCRADGSPLTSNCLHHKFKAVLDQCGLPEIRFHDLRHTNATLMLRNAIPAKIVSSMLGHSSIGITLDTYSHVITEMQSGATNAMNVIFQGL